VVVWCHILQVSGSIVEGFRVDVMADHIGRCAGDQPVHTDNFLFAVDDDLRAGVVTMGGFFGVPGVPDEPVEPVGVNQGIKAVVQGDFDRRCLRVVMLSFDEHQAAFFSASIFLRR